jgi:CheY-like chemotaxis protein
MVDGLPRGENYFEGPLLTVKPAYPVPQGRSTPPKCRPSRPSAGTECHYVPAQTYPVVLFTQSRISHTLGVNPARREALRIRQLLCLNHSHKLVPSPPLNAVSFWPKKGLAVRSTVMAHLTAVPNQDRIRVLAADATSMSTQLLVEALARDSQLQMIECPSNGAAILNLVKREHPDIAVISARLGDPAGAGFDLVREIRAQSSGTRIIVLLDASERISVIEAFRAGAQGVFCRTEPFRLLSKSIQCVHQGQVWASSTEFQFVLDAWPNLRCRTSTRMAARCFPRVRLMSCDASLRD